MKTTIFISIGVIQCAAAFRNQVVRIDILRCNQDRSSSFLDRLCSQSSALYGIKGFETRNRKGAPVLAPHCQARHAAADAQSYDPVSDNEGHFDKDPAPIRANPLIPAERYTTADWWKCLISLPKSQMLSRVSSHLIANTVFALIVWISYVLWPQQLRFLTAGFNAQHHLLLGNALGLLLVFRTNTAYDRFWEGRRLWGFMIGRIREVSPPPPKSTTKRKFNT